MRRKRLLWVSIASVATTFALGAAYAVREAYRRSEDPFQRALDRKIAEAELTLAYEITPTHSVTFRLLPTETEMKIVSHVNVPIDNPHDNKREYLYGVRFEALNSDHEVIWNNVYWEKTQATKIQPESALVPWEPAFYRDRQDVMPTDNRLTTFFAASLFTAAKDKKTTPKFLRVTLADSGYESGVCRAFRKVERPAEERPTAWQTIGRKTRYALTAHSVYSDDMLTEPEREALVAFKWERLFAEGRKNREYYIRPIYLTRTPAPDESDVADDFTRYLVSDRRHVAANVRGTGTLRIEVTFPKDVGSPPRNGVNIEVERLDLDGGMWWAAKRVVPKPTPETERERLDPVGYYDVVVPPGLHTFVVRADAPAAIRLNVDGAGMFVEGANGAEFLAVSGRWIDLDPHTSGATYYRSLGPSDLPILADISYNARLNSPVRIASRLRLDTKDTAPKRYSVLYDILDAQGRIVTSGRYEGTALQTPFDYYEAESLDPNVSPSTAETYQMPVPPNARTLRIRSTQIAEIALYSHEDRGEIPQRVPTKAERANDVIYFDCENPPDKEWRYFRPENYDELDRQNRGVGVRWFCRAIRRKSDSTNRIRLYDAEPVARLIKPDSLAATVDIMERLRQSDETDTATDSTFFETPVGKPFRLRVVDTDNPHHALPVGFEVARSRPSTRPLKMSLDGAPFQPTISKITQGRFALDEVPQGVRTIRFDEEAGTRVFVNREPSPATTSVWKRRTSYALARSTPIFVTVPKRSAAAQTLTIAVYAKDASPRVISTQIANPPPVAAGTDFAWSARAFQLDAWEPFEGFDTETGERFTKRLSVFVPLNEAFPPRDYRIKLGLIDGQAVAVRCLILDDEPFTVTANRDAALNLIGPGTLWVRWDGATRGAHLTSERWSALGESATERIPFVTRGVFPEARIVVPPGLHSYLLNVRQNRSAELYFYVDNPGAMLLGRSTFALSRKPLLRTRVSPETSTTRLYVTRNGDATPANFAIPTGARRLRVEARRIGTLPSFSTDSTNVRYVFTDETGKTSASSVIAATLEPTTALDAIAPQTSNTSKLVATGASYGFIQAPARARSIALVADDPRVALTLDAELPDFVPDTYLPEDTNSTIRAVNVIDSAHNGQWTSLVAVNHDAFFLEGRYVDVITQKVAVKPEEYVPSLQTRFWTAFAPRGSVQPDVELMERLDAASADAPADSQMVPVADVFDATWRELSTNKRLAFDLRGLPGFRLAERDVPVVCISDGNSPIRLTVWVDGGFRSALELSAGSGASTVHGVPLGLHTIEFRTEPRVQPVRLFAFVANTDSVAASDDVWAKRAYYRLAERDSLEVTVTKPSTAPYSVNVAGFIGLRSREFRLPLRVRVEPSRTASPVTGVTNLERIYYINGQATTSLPVTPVSGDVDSARSLTSAFRFTINLKEDIGVGKVRIVLSWDANAVGFLRFFGSDEGDRSYDPGQVAVLNAVGPGRLRVVAPNGVAGDRLRVAVLTPDGMIVRTELRMSAGDANGFASASAPLPSDGVTVRVENASQRRLALRFYAENDETAIGEVRPRYSTQTFIKTLPSSGVALEIPPEMRDEQTLRVTVRSPIPRAGAPGAARFRYRLLDDRQRVLSSGDCRLTLLPSYESAYAEPIAASPPSEAGQFYVETTREAASIVLEADKPAMFRLHRRLSAFVRETVLPDDYEQTPGVRVRPRIVSATEWEPIEPPDLAALALQGRLARVEEPVALISMASESLPPPASATDTIATAEALEPVEFGDTVYVMEPSLPDTDKELTVNAVTFFRIRPNADTAVTVIAPDAPTTTLPTDIRCLYRLSGSFSATGSLGAPPPSLRFLLDGREVVEMPVIAPQGFVTIPGVMPGRHLLRAVVDTKSRAIRDAVELFINQAPASIDKATPWKLRTTHTLSAGQASVLSVDKRANEEVSLTAVVYPEPDSSGETPVVISVTIDDGIRRGNAGAATEEFTNFRRRYSLPNALSTAFYLNRNDTAPGMAQTFYVPLLNDLTPGQHRVQIRIESGTPRARARFFIMRDGEATDSLEFRQSESDDARS